MMRAFGMTGVLTLSLAIHAGGLAWLVAGMPQGGGDGAGGSAARSVIASVPAYSDLAEAWSRPPETAALPEFEVPTTVEALEPPSSQPDTAPNLDAPLQLSSATPEISPEAPLPIAPRLETPGIAAIQPPTFAPDVLANPEQGTAAPPRPAQQSLAPPEAPDAPTANTGTTLAVASSIRPQSRPDQPEPAPARPQQAASGGNEGTTRGDTQQSSEPATGPADPALIAQWGGRIAARIAAGVPRVNASGEVTLQIVVGRDGRLQSVAVVRSSGNPELDAAGIRVVQRAGRFPSAPNGLTGTSFRFTVPLRFT